MILLFNLLWLRLIEEGDVVVVDANADVVDDDVAAAFKMNINICKR